jgi:hypothetical protein
LLKNKVLRSRELFGKFLEKTLHLEEESYEIAKLLGGFGHSFSINYQQKFLAFRVGPSRKISAMSNMHEMVC